MTLRLSNSGFSFTEIERAQGSIDPCGRADSRWQNATPARYMTTLDIEFERSDLPELRKLFAQFGVRLPE